MLQLATSTIQTYKRKKIRLKKIAFKVISKYEILFSKIFFNLISLLVVYESFLLSFRKYYSSPFNLSARSAAIKLSIISSMSPFKKFSI